VVTEDEVAIIADDGHRWAILWEMPRGDECEGAGAKKGGHSGPPFLAIH
jgi:hypothetical protein